MDSTVYVGGAIFREGLGSVPGWGIRVEGERIAAVLPDEVLRSQADAHTKVVELDGAFVSPAFTDAHLHPAVGGVDAGRCDLSGVIDARVYLEMIADYARAHPGRPWILGGGWSMEAFPGGTPRKEDLDSVVPDRPVALANRDRHGFWVNSRALEIAGVDARTPDPASGRIERDPDGTPTGTLHEGAADLVLQHQSEATEAEITAGLVASQQMCFSYGIAGWQDAIVGPSSVGPDNLGAYLAAAADGTLKARASLALWWDRERGLEQLEDLLARREQVARLGTGMRADSVKIMVDGVAENFSAAVSAPYLDSHGHQTDSLGLTHFTGAQLKEIVTELDRRGFQAH
ncbi:MAG: amidohydrolase family protein, partial [Propionibacteriaceae bacterium]|nr:amidohydrolase family protein [Propionibacteriaceae bacterium]